MDDLILAGTASCPDIEFRFSEHRLVLKGESYPENAAAFYGPLIERLKVYLERLEATDVVVDVALRYFNSSSTKILFNLFGMLHEAACAGNGIVVRWHYDPEDDTMLEFGRELSSDFPEVRFIEVPQSDVRV